MRKYLIVIIIILNIKQILAQDSLLIKRDTFPSRIETNFLDSSVKFTAIIRPLEPIPGGRKAYYTYLWDFGDGNFSTVESPEHHYEKAGDYDVSLYIVNNYDNGPRPKKPKTKVKVDSRLASGKAKPNSFEQQFFKSNGTFQLFKNANALPGEDMSIVVGVKPQAKKGKIIILTNEKSINPTGFVLANQSQYFQEKLNEQLNKEDFHKLWANVKSTKISQSGSPDYGVIEELTFNGQEASKFFNSLLAEYNTVSEYEIAAEEENTQFSLLNIDITPEMLADTNAIVTVTGIYIAEGMDPIVHKMDIPIIKSHDPNKMSVRPALIDYRLQFKKKTMTYKVQFQNDGEGDAKNIRLEMFFPEQVNTKTFKLLNLYPGCDTCKTTQDLGCYTYHLEGENKIIFNFKGIALPGTASPILTDQDSSKGFIRFTLQTHKKLQNKSLPSYTNIYFDKNEPIKTNKAVTRFRPGVSPLVFLGLNAPVRNSDDAIGKLTNGLTIGLGLAPIAPYRKPYWQVELYASTFSEKGSQFFDRAIGEVQVPDGMGNLPYYKFQGMDTAFQRKFIALQIPIQIRYNISRYISAGIGAMVKTNLNTSNNQTLTYHFPGNSGATMTHQVRNSLEKEKRSALLFSPLLDLNIGRVYLGPALGIRYHYDKTYKNNFNFYLMWRL
ncbi:PKD domain-containing protein [Sphingobacterium sp. HJSM2_6]|uniref:PKD domain-containing protein n=1 Tax=Sphingobacterium sp. HJSM2_6 TaxID=3366264 RepID=UPI003BDB3B91